MSTFFKALEQAEHEQALRDQAPLAALVSEPRPATTEAVPSRALPASLEPRSEVFNSVDEHLVSLLAPTSFEAEQYRALRYLIEQLHKSTDLSTLAVSSPTVADGKTTTAINLAGALAQAPDARVLLIDFDLREAALARQLGLDTDTGPGLVEAILDPNLTLDAVAHAHPHLNLSVLTAGRLPSAPYEVLKSPRVGELLAEARRRYDYIVLDTPPLVPVPDCRIIARWVDGFLVVVSAHRTPRELLEEALSVTEPAKVLGLVFNGDDRRRSRGHSYASRRRPDKNRGSWQSRLFSSTTHGRRTTSDD